MAGTIAELVVKIGADISGLQRGLSQANSAVTNIGKGMTKAGAALSIGLTAPLVAIGKASVDAATDFDREMRNIQSISKQTNTEIAALGQTFIGMSTDMRVTTDSAAELAAGFYNIQSSGFAGADAMTVLKAATMAASAGLTTTDVAATAIVATLNSYGQGAEMATHVSDVLFKTVDIGVLSFEELASNIGNVTGTANIAKVPIEQLGAAYATMTKGGISAAEATTAINRVMLAFISPTKQASAAAKAYGVELSATALAEKGLYGAIKDIYDVIGDDAEAWATLTGDVRGFKGVMALTRGEMKPFAADLLAIGDAAGATQQAFQIQTQSFEAQMKNLKNVLTALKIDLGTELLPILIGILQGIKPLVAAFKALPGPVKKGIVVFGMLAAALGPVLVVVGSIITAVGTIGGALSGLAGMVTAALGAIGIAGAPVLLVIGAIIAAVAALYLAWKTNFLGIRDLVSEFVRGWKYAAEQGLGFIERLRHGIGEALDNIMDEVLAWDIADAIAGLLSNPLGMFQEFIRGWQYAADQGLGFMDRLRGGIGEALDDILDEARAWDIADAIVGKLEAIIGAVPEFVSEFIRGWQYASEQGLGFIDRLRYGIGEALDNILGEVAAWDIADAIAGKLEAIADFFAGIWERIRGVIDGALVSILQSVGLSTEQATAIVTQAWANVATFLSGVWETLKTVAANIWAGIKTIIAMDIEFIKGVIATGLAVLAGDWDAAWETIKGTALNIWDAIKTGIGEKAGALVTDVVGKVIELKDKVLGFLGDLVEGALGKFGELATKAGELLGNIFGSIGDVAGGVVGGVKGLLGKLFGGGAPTDVGGGFDLGSIADLRTTVETAMTAITTAVTTMTAATQTAITTWLAAIQLGVTTTMPIIQANIATTMAAIFLNVTTVLATLGAFLATWLETTRTMIATTNAQELSDFATTWARIYSVTTMLMGQLRNTVVSLMQSMRTQVGGILQGMVSDAETAGKAFGEAVAKGIYASIPAAVAAASALAAAVRAVLPGSDAKEGPLSDLTASGRALPITLAKGIHRGEDKLIKAIGVPLDKANRGLALDPHSRFRAGGGRGLVDEPRMMAPALRRLVDEPVAVLKRIAARGKDDPGAACRDVSDAVDKLTKTVSKTVAKPLDKIAKATDKPMRPGLVQEPMIAALKPRKKPGLVDEPLVTAPSPRSRLVDEPRMREPRDRDKGINITIYNPEGEPTEKSITRQLRNLAYLGMIGANA